MSRGLSIFVVTKSCFLSGDNSYVRVVLLPSRLPGVTATSWVPCHCAAGGTLALSLLVCALDPLDPLPAEAVEELLDGLDDDPVDGFACEESVAE